MAVFRSDIDNLSERIDWKILQNGWASLYWKDEILNGDLIWLRKEKFEVVIFDCSSWRQIEKIHMALKKQLHFPDYYGENLNALNDCLSDLQINDNGTAIVFEHFQFIDKNYAHQLLDVFANNARQHMLFGKKLLTLIQVDDPKYHIDPIGACPVLWNNLEWLNKNRGL
jgi:RNAse (barnase) inhibitor barstar